MHRQMKLLVHKLELLTSQFTENLRHSPSPDVSPAMCSVSCYDGISILKGGIHSNATGFL